MAGGSASTDLLNQLAILVTLGAVGDLSDADLLRRFLAGPDAVSQAALTALVERHGPMVLNACRRVLGDSHDGQDAFQATFLVLARRAGSVRKADSVASWLHGVALRVAARAKADAARRRAFERRGAATRAVESAIERDGRGSWPELHEEIARLPERYREPVVLCYLEGLTTEAAARRLDCPRGTILSRLARGRERLRAGLTRRGLTPAVALLSMGLSPVTAKAAISGGLVDATVQVAMQFAVGRLAVVRTISTPVNSLAERLLRAMLLTKLKMVAVFILAAGALAVGVAAPTHRGRAVGALSQAPEAVPAPSQIARAGGQVKPEDGASIPFQKVGLGADDLIEATGLNLYKFLLEMPKGHRFRVVLRELKSDQIPPRVLYSYPFEKSEDVPTTIRVGFLRLDHSLQGVLLSQEAEAEFRLDITGCYPSGIVTIVPLPLGGTEPTRKTLLWHKSDKDNRKYDLKETRLITIVASEPGKPAPTPTSYPRAELVIVKDQ